MNQPGILKSLKALAQTLEEVPDLKTQQLLLNLIRATPRNQLSQKEVFELLALEGQVHNRVLLARKSSAEKSL